MPHCEHCRCPWRSASSHAATAALAFGAVSALSQVQATGGKHGFSSTHSAPAGAPRVASWQIADAKPEEWRKFSDVLKNHFEYGASAHEEESGFASADAPAAAQEVA